MGRPSKEALAIESRQVLHGIKTQLAHVDSFTLAGTSYSRQELVAAFQRVLDAERDREAASAAYTAAVAREDALHEEHRALRNAFRSFVESTFGKTSSKLALFGLDRKAPAQPKTEVKAAAVEKRRATREARGTMGKRQKSKIKGKPEEPKGQ